MQLVARGAELHIDLSCKMCVSGSRFQLRTVGGVGASRRDLRSTASPQSINGCGIVLCKCPLIPLAFLLSSGRQRAGALEYFMILLPLGTSKNGPSIRKWLASSYNAQRYQPHGSLLSIPRYTGIAGGVAPPQQCGLPTKVPSVVSRIHLEARSPGHLHTHGLLNADTLNRLRDLLPHPGRALIYHTSSVAWK